MASAPLIRGRLVAAFTRWPAALAVMSCLLAAVPPRQCTQVGKFVMISLDWQACVRIVLMGCVGFVSVAQCCTSTLEVCCTALRHASRSL